MKLAFRVLSMVVIMVGVMTYGTYLMTGRVPWQGLKFTKKPDIKLPANLSMPGKTAEKDQVYKWKDADGVWHFSSEPPTDAATYDLLEIDPNQNVVASTPVETEQEEDAASDKGAQEPESDALDFPYSPTRVKKLMDDARDVQNTVNDRAAAQKELLDNL